MTETEEIITYANTVDPFHDTNLCYYIFGCLWDLQTLRNISCILNLRGIKLFTLWNNFISWH